jgi:MYXO-CTERM domain-containing protein
LQALGVVDNDASSMYVAEGYEVILYDGDNFTGNSVTYSEDSSCFTDNGFNDQASSLKIVNLNPPTGTGGTGGTSTGGTGGNVATGGATTGGTTAMTGGTGATTTGGSGGTTGGTGSPPITSSRSNGSQDTGNGSSCQVSTLGAAPAGSHLVAFLMGALGLAWVRRRRVAA